MLHFLLTLNPLTHPFTVTKNYSHAFPVSKEPAFRVPNAVISPLNLCRLQVHPSSWLFSLTHYIYIPYLILKAQTSRPDVLCRVFLWSFYSFSSIANRCRHGTVELEGDCAPGLTYEDLPHTDHKGWFLQHPVHLNFPLPGNRLCSVR